MNKRKNYTELANNSFSLLHRTENRNGFYATIPRDGAERISATISRNWLSGMDPSSDLVKHF
jgi:hypothetical protein